MSRTQTAPAGASFDGSRLERLAHKGKYLLWGLLGLWVLSLFASPLVTVGSRTARRLVLAFGRHAAKAAGRRDAP
jgi:hypothetical protein